MAITFELLKLTQPGLFGARLSGSVGRAEKDRLREFNAKCVANGKHHVILDLAELDAISGGGAALLASFQQELRKLGGEVVFAGANEIVRRFLALQFGDLPFRNFPDVRDAETALAAVRVAAAMPFPPAAEAARDDEIGDAAGPVDAADPDDTAGAATGADSTLDALLDAFATPLNGPDQERRARRDAAPVAGDGPNPPSQRNESREPNKVASAAAAPAPSEAATGRAAIPSADPANAGTGGVARPQFVPLDSALAALRGAADASALAGPLRDLLHSSDLAVDVTLCVRRGDVFVAAGGATFAADGRLAAALATAGRPVLLLDAGDLELSEPEARLLADLRADILLPIVRNGSLAAVALVHRGGDEREYGVSEVFALSLLSRWLAEPEGGGGDDADRVEAAATTPAAMGADRDLSAELRRKSLQMQALCSMSEDFAHAPDGARLMDQLCVTVTAQLGVRVVAVLELEGETLTPRLCRGIEAERLPSLSPFGPQMQAWLVEQPLPVPVSELPPLLHRFQDPLTDAGIAFVGSLRARDQVLGMLLLGGATRGGRTELDLDFLSTLLNQAATAMDNARMLQVAHDQNIGVIRTLVSLIEQRHQGGNRVTERVSSLVAEVAREVNFAPEKMRDLVYGTVLRDIGMIPISDLVLRSPRKLTEVEWQQVKGHPEAGVELLGPLQLAPIVREVVLCHHERFNGEGYPRGLQGRAIPLSARIVAVVDSFVAMVSDLPYRTALSAAEAISILSENWGMRYDPDIVEAFLRVLARDGVAGQTEGATVDATAVAGSAGGAR